MSLFRRSGEERRAIRDLPWGEWDRESGESLTPERALRLAPVFGAANLLAGKISSLPLQVYQESRGGKSKVPLPALFQRPAARGNRHNWMFRAVAGLALRGNAVGWITARDDMGYATMVEWLPHTWVNVQDSDLSGPGSFIDPIWRILGRPVPTEDIVHVPWFVMPGRVWGLSPIQAFASSANIALSAQEYKNDWFKAGGVPPGTFRNETQKVEQDDAKVIKARLVQAIRSHEPLVYGADWQYTPNTIPQTDAEFVETMQLSATQIAVIYGIPPAKIGGTTGESLTYSTVEQNAIDLVNDVLLPWFTRFEAAFDQLLPPNQYVKFNVDSMLRADIQTRYQVYQIARNLGLMNRDEIRDLEDETPLPNGEGQDYTPLELLYASDAHSTRPPSGRPVGPPKSPGATPGAPQGTPDLVRALYDPSDDIRAVSKLQETPQGRKLWRYWTGEGKARWAASPTPYRTLRAELAKEQVPLREIDGLAAEIFHEVFGMTPEQHAEATGKGKKHG